MTGKKSAELEAYSTDASMIEGEASGLVFPKSAEEISRIIRAGSNFVVRGGGTGLVGGAVPLNSTVIDVSKMNKILKIEKDKGIAEVEAGVILGELNSELSKYNLEFPVKPSSHEVCTVGGMIATNAVGSRAIKYGRTTNWIEEVEVVNGKGEIMKAGKASLSDFAGMEGISGIITWAKLRLIEKRDRTASLLKFDSITGVIDEVNKLKLMNDVCSIEFLDKLVSGVLGMENKYHLIVEYESDKGQLANEMYDDLMRLRDEVYPSLAKLGYVKIEDPKILLHKFIELVDFLESGKVPFFGHLGSGIIHPVFRNGEDERIGLLMKYVRSIHGSVSGEHGIGLRKREFLDAMEKKLIERVKKRHDPLCKINCGKVIAKSDSPALESQDIKKEKILEIEKQIDEQNKQAEKTQEEKHDSRV